MKCAECGCVMEVLFQSWSCPACSGTKSDHVVHFTLLTSADIENMRDSGRTGGIVHPTFADAASAMRALSLSWPDEADECMIYACTPEEGELDFRMCRDGYAWCEARLLLDGADVQLLPALRVHLGSGRRP